MRCIGCMGEDPHQICQHMLGARCAVGYCDNDKRYSKEQEYIPIIHI